MTAPFGSLTVPLTVPRLVCDTLAVPMLDTIDPEPDETVEAVLLPLEELVTLPPDAPRTALATACGVGSVGGGTMEIDPRTSVSDPATMRSGSAPGVPSAYVNETAKPPSDSPNSWRASWLQASR